MATLILFFATGLVLSPRVSDQNWSSCPDLISASVATQKGPLTMDCRVEPGNEGD